jgi:hypothetical protein
MSAHRYIVIKVHVPQSRTDNPSTEEVTNAYRTGQTEFIAQPDADLPLVPSRTVIYELPQDR